MPAIASTSGRLHSEFVRLLFLQDHRETDRFFAASGVQLAHSHPGGQVTFRHAALLFTLANFSFVNLVFIFRCSSTTTNPVYERRVNLLVYSLSLHRHSYIGLILAFSSSIHNNNNNNNNNPTRMPKRNTTGWLIKLLTFFAQRIRLKHSRWLKPEVVGPGAIGVGPSHCPRQSSE
jgi:hypothetical protein